MTDILRVVPGQFWASTEDEKAYTVNVGNWMTAPTSASAVIYEGATDRSASNFQSNGSANATISGSLITTPCIVSLRDGTDYQVEIKFEQGGEVLECFFNITGTDLR